MLQAVHIHASPDGPWFFLIAGADPASRACRLIGITDTSMLRPQVFALQRGAAAIGFAASERQGIDAALESLSAADPRFWSQADLYWNARGGSHTDGGAFVFTVERDGSERSGLVCADKFGRTIDVPGDQRPPAPVVLAPAGPAAAPSAVAALARRSLPAAELFGAAGEALPRWSYGELSAFLDALVGEAGDDDGRSRALEVLTRLRDRRLPTGALRRSGVVAAVDRALDRLFEDIRQRPSAGFLPAAAGSLPERPADGETVVLDARAFPPEGPNSAARAVVALARAGFRRIVVAGARGHRFIGCGLPPQAAGLRLDVYGASGDYLASGLDDVEVTVHGAGQDQLAQIMKGGRLVVHGDVGQTFGYAAKGGDVYILGNAAGRPLINAVGRPRVVINGTCLDYLAESFMAGDPLAGGGFVVLNGVRFDGHGRLVELDTPYPGGNLFSLASGGAIYVRDPNGRLGDDQLNGGAFAAVADADWRLIVPHLEENQRLFGIAVETLLEVDGRRMPPERVYRKIAPSGHKALLPEEAWVRKEA
jgi:glutamate synthase domain-containing protein 3